MTIIGIIKQSESEHATPCKVGEWRLARLTMTEATCVEKHLNAGRKFRGWDASVVKDGKRAKLRYTKSGVG